MVRIYLIFLLGYMTDTAVVKSLCLEFSLHWWIWIRYQHSRALEVIVNIINVHVYKKDMHIQYIFTRHQVVIQQWLYNIEESLLLTLFIHLPLFLQEERFYTLNYKHTESSKGVLTKNLCSQMLEILMFQNLLHNTIFYTRTMIKSWHFL